MKVRLLSSRSHLFFFFLVWGGSALTFVIILFIGTKSSVHTHLNYLIIISPPFIPSAASASATVRNFVARAPEAEGDITKVTVFDLENKLVAYSGTFAEGIREVVSQWGRIYVLGNDGKVRFFFISFFHL
jgi:hypothetical protein